MKFLTFLLILLLIVLLILLLKGSSIKTISKKWSKPRWNFNKALEMVKIMLFTSSVLIIIKCYKMLDFLGLIKRINQEEIIAISIGLTLILFAYTLIIHSSQKMRTN